MADAIRHAVRIDVVIDDIVVGNITNDLRWSFDKEGWITLVHDSECEVHDWYDRRVFVRTAQPPQGMEPA